MSTVLPLTAAETQRPRHARRRFALPPRAACLLTSLLSLAIRGVMRSQLGWSPLGSIPKMVKLSYMNDDDPKDHPTPLTGGHFSRPVRSEGEVRKPRGTWTQASFELLQFLEARHFVGAPRAIRIEGSGEGVFSYLEGDVAAGAPLPGYVWSEESLIDVTKLLRRLHDVTEGWRPQSEDWRRIPGAPQSVEVMCHNDAAPWNTVFRGGRPVGLIDWDSAAPGTRLWDLGYLVWHWVPLWPDDRALAHGFTDLPSRAPRLATIVASYGRGVTAGEVLDAALQRQQAWRDQLTEGARAGVTAYVDLVAAGSATGILADLRYTNEHRDELLRAL